MEAIPALLLATASLSDVELWARTNGLEVVFIITGSILLARLVGWSSDHIARHIDRQAAGRDSLVRSEEAKHRHAVTNVVRWVTIVLLYAVAVVLVVERLDVPLTSLVAPATVAGVAVGFGAQRVVQDVLAGFLIITERQYGFGDVIRFSTLGATTGVTGTVEDVNLRITRLRTVNGEVVIVPNGQIVQVTNLSRDWARAVIDVPVPPSADVNRVSGILRDVGETAFADPDLRPLLLDAPSVMGVETLSVDQLEIRLVARTLPGRQFDVGRALRSRIAVAFLRAGLTVPTALTTDPDTGDEQTGAGAVRTAAPTAVAGNASAAAGRPGSGTGDGSTEVGRSGSGTGDVGPGDSGTGTGQVGPGDSDQPLPAAASRRPWPGPGPPRRRGRGAAMTRRPGTVSAHVPVRISTVVLAVVFAAAVTAYLFVRPRPVVAPSGATVAVVPTTTAPPTTTTTTTVPPASTRTTPSSTGSASTPTSTGTSSTGTSSTGTSSAGTSSAGTSSAGTSSAGSSSAGSSSPGTSSIGSGGSNPAPSGSSTTSVGSPATSSAGAGTTRTSVGAPLAPPTGAGSSHTAGALLRTRSAATG